MRVLPALAARERQQRDADAEAARKISHQSAVFIVRMSDDDEHAGRGAEALEGLLEIGGAAILGQRQRFAEGSGNGTCASSALRDEGAAD